MKFDGWVVMMMGPAFARMVVERGGILVDDPTQRIAVGLVERPAPLQALPL
jgi:hypothetical protein